MNELVTVALIAVIIFQTFMLVSVLKSQQKYLEQETSRFESLTEKILLACKSEDPAKSISTVESNRESLRQHAKTFDVELAKYKKVLKKTEDQEVKAPEPEMLVDQHGKPVEIVDLES